MSQLSTAALTKDSLARDHTSATALFKDDRPRRIDRFIDYFGGDTTVAAGDPGGESVLDDLRSEDE